MFQNFCIQIWNISLTSFFLFYFAHGDLYSLQYCKIVDLKVMLRDVAEIMLVVGAPRIHASTASQPCFVKDLETFKEGRVCTRGPVYNFVVFSTM
jgi:hypothetical protein